MEAEIYPRVRVQRSRIHPRSLRSACRYAGVPVNIYAIGDGFSGICRRMDTPDTVG